jgi:hypothetical protein
MTVRSAEREQFLADVIVCAVEGGTGYWAQVPVYRCDVAAETRATLLDVVEPASIELTLDKVEAGLEKVRERGFAVSPRILEAVIEAERELDAGVIDADAADVIVQAAAFGEIRYA